MLRRVFSTLGEAVVQFGIIAGFIFLLERLGWFMITIEYLNTDIIWAGEGVGMLALFLLLTLGMANMIFAFFPYGDWIQRALLETGIVVALFVLISAFFTPLVIFAYSPLWLFALLGVGIALCTNLAMNWVIRAGHF